MLRPRRTHRRATHLAHSPESKKPSGAARNEVGRSRARLARGGPPVRSDSTPGGSGGGFPSADPRSRISTGRRPGCAIDRAALAGSIRSSSPVPNLRRRTVMPLPSDTTNRRLAIRAGGADPSRTGSAGRSPESAVGPRRGGNRRFSSLAIGRRGDISPSFGSTASLAIRLERGLARGESAAPRPSASLPSVRQHHGVTRP